MVTIVQAQKWLIADKHLLNVDPLKLQLRKVESARPYCYTGEQVAAMVKLCRSNESIGWLANVIIALAATGLRIAELASLKWTDLDLENGRLTLTDESGHAKKKNSERRRLKSGRSRSLPIHPDLAAALDAIPRTDTYVFHGPRRGRLKPDTVRQILVREVISPLSKQFCNGAGEQSFADGRLHSFRHYFVSTCVNKNIPERMTMLWLGHRDSEMVRQYYHLHDDEARRQMDRLDPLGKTGKQLTGIQGAAVKNQEAPSQESDPAIAT